MKQIPQDYVLFVRRNTCVLHDLLSCKSHSLRRQIMFMFYTLLWKVLNQNYDC